MIGYKMGFSLVGVYTTSKTSPMRSMDEKNDIIANMATLFDRGVL